MYKRILVPIDGSAASLRGLHDAIGLAADQAREGRARLVLLHVVEEFGPVGPWSDAQTHLEAMESSRREGQSLLRRAHAMAFDANVQADTVLREVIQRAASEVVVEEAGAHGCDLIVMGTHGRRGFERLLLGSTAQEVTRDSPVPVLLVRPPDAPAGLDAFAPSQATSLPTEYVRHGQGEHAARRVCHGPSP